MINSLQKLLADSEYKRALYMATDINEKALEVSSRTAKQNSCSLDLIQTSFATYLLPRLSKALDILLYNPVTSYQMSFF